MRKQFRTKFLRVLLEGSTESGPTVAWLQVQCSPEATESDAGGVGEYGDLEMDADAGSDEAEWDVCVVDEHIGGWCCLACFSRGSVAHSHYRLPED